MNRISRSTTRSAPGQPNTRTLGRCMRDGGYVIIFTSLLLIPLLGIVGLSTDVGSWYVTANRIQRAADAAALAGVVWLPNESFAEANALAAARQNGFDPDTDPNITVDVIRISENQIQVIITDKSVDLFFSSLFLDSLEIARGSVAEYVQPLPMGSPLNTFGNTGLDGNGDPLPGDPQFWAAINGPRTPRRMGDPFATMCDLEYPPIEPSNPAFTETGTSCADALGTVSSAPTNVDYRPDGYYYGVKVEAPQDGSAVTVDIFDPAFHDRGVANETGDSFIYSTVEPVLHYEMLDIDSTPLDHTDNPPLPNCSFTADNANIALRNNWIRLCRITFADEGIYPIRVTTSDPRPFGFLTHAPNGMPTDGSSTAQYSMRVGSSCAATCGQPKLFGIGDISIYTNAGNNAATDLFLAQVTPAYAGKSFEVDMFDPGDGPSGDYFVSLLEPGGGVAPSCRWNSSNGLSGTAAPCRIQTRDDGAVNPNRFDGEWLTIEVDLANDYTCTGCWWKVSYEFGGGSTDRTTWRVRINGDPVRIVE